jgi:hypothetical protein
MLFPEIDGVKYSEVFLVNANDVQYQFISSNKIEILVMLELVSIFNKACFDSDDQMLVREYK